LGEEIVDSALTVHRLHFAFTATFHYLFPQLTMGLAPLIVVCKLLALRRQDEKWNEAPRLLGRVFAISFVFGDCLPSVAVYVDA
jgi:cytochrome d ubiquinol oxidase subunit I